MLIFVSRHNEKQIFALILVCFSWLCVIMLNWSANTLPITSSFHYWINLWQSNYRQWTRMFCHIIIIQFHNITSNVNRWTLARKIKWQPICRHYCHMPIMAVMVLLLPNSLIFLASFHLLTLLVILWNCVILMLQNIPHSLPIVLFSYYAYFLFSSQNCLLLAKCLHIRCILAHFLHFSWVLLWKNLERSNYLGEYCLLHHYGAHRIPFSLLAHTVWFIKTRYLSSHRGS